MREGWEDWCVVSSGRAKYKKYRQMDNRALQCSTIKCTLYTALPRWKEQTRVEKWDPTTFPFPGKSIQGKLSTELNHSGAESSSSSQRIIIDIGYRDKEFGWSGIVETGKMVSGWVKLNFCNANGLIEWCDGLTNSGGGRYQWQWLSGNRNGENAKYRDNYLVWINSTTAWAIWH